jgi:O-antigen/teichoic acid export membrane protein
MINPIKKLVGQTAIYGFSSIVGRLLNWFLVPIYIGVANFSTDQYGIITEMYSYVAFLVVFLTYGMETAYFRFSTLAEFDVKKVFSTVILSLCFTSFLFIALSFFFNQSIANWLMYPNHPEYVIWFALIVGLDAISAIPMAKLRKEQKALKFALINLINIFINIGLNLFFLAYCLPKSLAGESNYFIETFYNPDIGVGYVFISNLIASIVKFLLLLPDILKAQFSFEFFLFRKMFFYALPLLIFGLAGIVNETIDRIMLKRILIHTMSEKETLSQIGIYGACYKISIIITLFIQAFRYAAEPFFFAQEKKDDSNLIYSKVMNYFTIVCATIFLGVMLFIDVVKYFIPNEEYWDGLKVVPILLMANVFLGIYYNQSIWYKLSGKTIFGAYIGLFGATITIILNLYLIPIIGYYGSALATLICYASMVILSYFLGLKYYPIKYNLPKIFLYLSLAVGMYYLKNFFDITVDWINYVTSTILFTIFILIVIFIEKPKKILKNQV